MDKELKIVLSVFLVFFIYALSSFFNQGVFLAPIVLSRFTIVVVSFCILLLNLKKKGAYILILYFISTLFLALTDSFSIGYLGQKFKTDFFLQITDSLTFLLLSFIFYFGFLFFSILLYFQNTKNALFSILLSVVLISLILLFFTEYYLAKEILIHLFFLIYFIIIQYSSNISNKIIQLLSYQYLLVVLLESFEYFV